MSSRCFNSRTRVGATFYEGADRFAYIVSIHAPVWVRRVAVHSSIDIKLFQFTHPCGCDNPRNPRVQRIPCFNSRTRVGATAIIQHTVETRPFQFTHPCGCDGISSANAASTSCFNSRTRVGATVSRVLQAHRRNVSIHAPVWVRLHSIAGDNPFVVFQFTHPCGCDPRDCRPDRRENSFNSRTRVGATETLESIAVSVLVSIHAPVWVRQGMRKLYPQHKSFNSRTRVGATGVLNGAVFGQDVSIHAPVWVRQALTDSWATDSWFQFTHPCGCDGLTNTV